MSVRLEDLPDVITAKDISDALDICYGNALKLIRFGNLRYFKLGNSYRVTKKDFAEWLYNSTDTTIEFD